MHVENHEKVERKMRKSVNSNENGDQITYMFFITGLQVYSSSLRCAFCYLKNQYFLEARPHYNPGKDPKIHVSNMFVIGRCNEKKL